MNEQKIGTVEIMKVSRHGSGYYLRLKKELVEVYNVKKGDKMRVKLETLIKPPGDTPSGNPYLTPSRQNQIHGP